MCKYLNIFKYLNSDEAEIVALYVNRLLFAGVRTEDIGVVSPYKLQVSNHNTSTISI